MTNTKRIPSRSEVRTEDTWDLSPLFKNDAAWERAYRKLEKMIEDFAAFRGTLGKSAENLKACLDFEIRFEKEAERLGAYAQLKYAEDISNSQYLGMVSRFSFLATIAAEAASFVAPEIQAIPAKRMKEFLESETLKPYRFNLEKLLRFKKHILSLPEERLLALQGEVSGAADKIFGQLTDADFKFGFVTNENGERVELTQGSFRSLLESPKRGVRKEAFNKFYSVYDTHANSLAACLSSSVLQDVYQMRARNYPSCLEMELFGDKVPVSVYNSLIDAVHAEFDTVYRYMELRRRALKIKDIHAYDTYVPLTQSVRRKTTFDQAVTMTCAALEPLGAEYCRVLESGLRKDRWVDRYENKGKSSGAFSAGGYSGPPYILMNYQDDVLDHVFTLAHEAGHSMHTWLSAKKQPFQYYGYTIFVAEVASTFNEQLLNRYLLDRADSKDMRLYLVCREIDEIRGTLVRQTMFAEYEKILHALAEQGEPLTLERLRAEYRSLLDAYFGPGFVVDPLLELEGMRIPHFYHSFYVYKYATGIAAAIALSRRVLEGGPKERKQYLDFLSGGGSKYPLDLLRDAGVDMESPEPVAMAMARFKELVDELEKLV